MTAIHYLTEVSRSRTLSSRDFGDVIFTTTATTVAFDCRGRPTTGAETTFAFENSPGTTQVDVTGSGDVTHKRDKEGHRSNRFEIRYTTFRKSHLSGGGLLVILHVSRTTQSNLDGMRWLSTVLLTG